MNITTSRAATAALACALVTLATGCSKTPDPDYSGSELYAGNCANCHGLYADGMGPAAASIAQHVPDLRQIAAENGGVFPRDLVVKIIDGRELPAAHADDVMPKWGNEFQVGEGFSEQAAGRVEAKIEALTEYIESIQITQ